VAVERIDYQAGGVTGKGALVWNENIGGKRPLLLVMPNWLGVTENAINRARRMAGDKYVAFVGCMYGEGKTCQGPPTSQEWMMAVRGDRVEGRKRVNAALATMAREADKRGIGDSSKKAAVGFCFGLVSVCVAITVFSCSTDAPARRFPRHAAINARNLVIAFGERD